MLRIRDSTRGRIFKLQYLQSKGRKFGFFLCEEAPLNCPVVRVTGLRGYITAEIDSPSTWRDNFH